MLKYKLDDVVNAVAIHLSPGVWGVVSIGFFARPSNLRQAYSIPECVPISFCASCSAGLVPFGDGYFELTCQRLKRSGSGRSLVPE